MFTKTMRLRHCGKFFLLISSLAIYANCLFEDQAGTYDWRQQYVGKPVYSRIDSNTNRLYLATDQHVLACLNLKTGNILWRKIFESSEIGQIDHLLWSNKEAIVVTNSGQRIQAFDYSSGFSSWEYTLFNPVASKQVKFESIVSKQNSDVYYITNGYQLCSVSGKEKACVELPSEGFVYENLFDNEHGVYLIGAKDNHIQKLHYNSLLTQLVSKVQSSPNNSLKNSNCIKSSDENALNCFSDSDGQIFRFEVTSESSKFESANTFLAPRTVFQDSIASKRSVLQLKYASQDTFIVELTNEQKSSFDLYVFKREKNEQELVLVKKLDQVLNYDSGLRGPSNRYYLVYAKYLAAQRLNLFVLDLQTVQERTDLSVGLDYLEKEHKSIQLLHANIFDAKNSQLGLKFVLFFEDYSLCAYNGKGKRYFLREEALAYISSVEMIDFPMLHLQEEFEDEFGSSKQENILKMFYKRIRTQLVQLREFLFDDLYFKLMQFLNNQNAIYRSSSLNQELSVDEITRDEFNLNKLIIVGTSIGKIFGLYTSANGRILWSFYLKNTLPFKLNKFDSKNNNVMPLFVQRTAAHVPYEAQCALVTKQKNESNQVKSKVYFFNPLTGQMSRDHPADGYSLDYDIKQAFLYNHHDSHYLKPLVLFDTQNKLHVLPDKAAREILARHTKPSIVYTTLNDNENDGTSVLAGFGLKSFNNPLSEVWRVSLEDERIVAIAAKLPNDRIHSHGKVLGDRSVLYKYLNPNLVGVATTGQDGQKVPFINLYLIDTVTGQIVSSFNYKRCKGPVNIVHSENWFFLSYYNTKFRRNEVTSIELFEGSTQRNSSHFSSLDDIKPVVHSKSYIVQRSFDAMQVTLTEKGISTKDVIVACKFGVIVEIPWLLIDPRRPSKMTDVEREENLLPYMPEIPLNYEFSLNYYNYVYNIRGIATAPTGLESTSLVFAYGLDVFFTRVFPSKTFDMLREDFDYFFIITLVVGLLVGTVLSKKLAKAANLKKAWK